MEWKGRTMRKSDVYRVVCPSCDSFTREGQTRGRDPEGGNETLIQCETLPSSHTGSRIFASGIT